MPDNEIDDLAPEEQRLYATAGLFLISFSTTEEAFHALLMDISGMRESEDMARIILPDDDRWMRDKLEKIIALPQSEKRWSQSLRDRLKELSENLGTLAKIRNKFAHRISMYESRNPTKFITVDAIKKGRTKGFEIAPEFSIEDMDNAIVDLGQMIADIMYFRWMLSGEMDDTSSSMRRTLLCTPQWQDDGKSPRRNSL